MIGQTVSHYRITGQLGTGGMGIVYQAEDNKLKRTVALKFLPPELTRDSEAKARFVHEAQAASALDHPNICTIFEIGETDDGQLFIAMACYEGETLKERIARGPLPLDEAIDIARQIAEGLAKAHERPIVHRDIKPANIFITKDRLVKVVDFGLAKLAGQTKLTRTGTTLGTVAYMPPEQAKGAETDHRGDLWSLGALLYEMITGRRAFAGDNEQAVIYAILNVEPEPVTGVRTGVPKELERIVGKCLAKEAGERYQSAAGFLSDLRPLLRSLSETSIPSGRMEPSWSSTRPGLRWPWILGLVYVGVALGIVTWLILKPGKGKVASEEIALAVMDFQDLVTPEKLITTKGMAGLLHVGFVESCPIRVISPEYLQDLRRRHFGDVRGPIEESQALEVARKAGATYLLTGQIAMLGSDRYATWRLVDVREGRSLAAKRVDGSSPADLADRIVAEVLPTLAKAVGVEGPASASSVGTITTNSSEAYAHYIAGILALDRVQHLTAIREFEAAVALDSTFALSYYGLSDAYYASSRIEKGPARLYADQAWRHRTKLGIKDRLRLEAWREHINDRIHEAITLYREILIRWPDDRQALDDLTELLFDQGYFEEGLSVASQGVELYPDDWVVVNMYANLLGLVGDMQKALDESRAYAERHPLEPQAWHEVGQRYYEMALPDSAELAYRRALDIDPTFWYSYRHICYCQFCRGDVESAIQNNWRLLAQDYLLPGDRVWLLTYVSHRPGLPVLFSEIGQFNKALACFDEAEKIVTTMEGIIGVHARRARVIIRKGNAKEALDWARMAINQTDTRRALFEVKYVEAQALVALDSLEAARAALHELWSLGVGREIGSLFAIRAGIELAENSPNEALATLREWSQRGRYRIGGLDDIEYREMTAQAHRMAGRLDEAAMVHEEMLRVYGGHFLSHFDLAVIYEEMGRKDEAEREYRTFLRAWAEADDGLSQVEDAKRRLEALKSRS